LRSRAISIIDIPGAVFGVAAAQAAVLANAAHEDLGVWCVVHPGRWTAS
jgi:hypothetical protein